MTRSYLALAAISTFLLAAVSTIAAVPVAVCRLVERGVEFVWGLVDDLAHDFRLPARDGGTTFDDPFRPLDRALLNSLRHEAGMRPLRC